MKKKVKKKNEKSGEWVESIGLSLWVVFKPHEKELMMKLFEMSLDDQIERAKKSHRIKLRCLWKNLGCYKKGEGELLAKKREGKLLKHHIKGILSHPPRS